MDENELVRRFNYHPATTDEDRDKQALIRNACLDLAFEIDSAVPDGREKDQSITNLEQTMFWANAAIARRGRHG